jgi:hypothetical protein
MIYLSLKLIRLGVWRDTAHRENFAVRFPQTALAAVAMLRNAVPCHEFETLHGRPKTENQINDITRDASNVRDMQKFHKSHQIHSTMSNVIA